MARPVPSFNSGILAWALCALAASPAFAGDQTWSGSGPIPPGAESRQVHTLVLDPATGTLHAGTGSGTVLSFSDSALSEPPVAVDDSATGTPDTDLDIAVLANDFDPEGALDAASLAVQAAPGHGTATAHPGGMITYSPASGFTGDDLFTYTVRDRAGAESNAARVTIRIDRAGRGGGGGGGGSAGPLALLLLCVAAAARRLRSPGH